MRTAGLMAGLCGILTGWLSGQQTTVVYDGFDYLTGGCLAGGATGQGWSGTWGEAGDSGADWSELIIGPGSFPVIPGEPAVVGNHVDLNIGTGDRRLTRRFAAPIGGGTADMEIIFSCVMDFGPATGIDYAGIELSNSTGGATIFLGKPPGAGPSNAGTIGMDIYGQGYTATTATGSGKKFLQLRWSPNPSGPESLSLLVRDATTGQVFGNLTRTVEASFDQVTLVARRDVAAGGAIPAFDELRFTTGPVQMRTLQLTSENPSSGVAITLTPDDTGGAGSGNTPLTRIYREGTLLNLTAPSSAAGNAFVKWRLNGADISTRRTIALTMTGDQNLVAIFLAPATVSYTLSVNASGTNAGVQVTLSPADLQGSGNGTTPFSRVYQGGTAVTLGAPELPGMTFLRWDRDGSPAGSTRSITPTLDAARTFTAVYKPRFDEKLDPITFDADGAKLCWTGIPGRTYVVEAGSSLNDFAPISGPIVADGQGSSFTENLIPRPARRFYRLKITAP